MVPLPVATTDTSVGLVYADGLCDAPVILWATLPVLKVDLVRFTAVVGVSVTFGVGVSVFPACTYGDVVNAFVAAPVAAVDVGGPGVVVDGALAVAVLAAIDVVAVVACTTDVVRSTDRLLLVYRQIEYLHMRLMLESQSQSWHQETSHGLVAKMKWRPQSSPGLR